MDDDIGRHVGGGADVRAGRLVDGAEPGGWHWPRTPVAAEASFGAPGGDRACKLRAVQGSDDFALRARR